MPWSAWPLVAESDRKPAPILAGVSEVSARHLSETAGKNSFGKPFWARSRAKFANCFITTVCAPTLKRSLAVAELLAFRKMSVSNVFGKRDQASLTQLLKRLHLLVDCPYVVFAPMTNTTYR